MTKRVARSVGTDAPCAAHSASAARATDANCAVVSDATDVPVAGTPAAVSASGGVRLAP